MSFIYKFPTIHQSVSWDYPNGPRCPLGLRISRIPTKVTVLFEVYISISSNLPEFVHGFTQWALVPFGTKLIWNTKPTNSFLWGIYINFQQSTKTFPGVNPVVLGASWAKAYLEHQKKEHSSVRFIYQSPTIHQNISNDYPNETWRPLVQRLSIITTKGKFLFEVYMEIPGNKCEELTWSQSMHWWRKVKSQELAHSPQTSTNLREKQIQLSSLDMSHLKFANTPHNKFQDQWMLIQLIWYTQVYNQQKKAWTKKLTNVLDEEKQ